MIEWITNLLDSEIFMRANGIFGFILLGFFIYFYFSKEGKDERGRGLIATSTFVSYIAMFLILNIFTMRLSFFMDNWNRMMNMIQTIYTLFLLIADISLLILRKIR